MIRLILTDLDGTLLPAGGGMLAEPFVQKIKNLTDRGMLFAVNSGRSYNALRKILKPLAGRTVFICNDGAQIMYQNCLLYKNPIPSDAAAALFNAANQLGVSCFAALREQTVPIPAEALTKKSLFGEDIYKLILTKGKQIEDDFALLRGLGESLDLRACFEDECYLEFCLRTADKGSAAAYLKQRFQIQKHIAAFGDAPADLAMFREADRVFVMKSAKEVSFPGATVIDDMQEYVVREF